jgi:hypothetical protein
MGEAAEAKQKDGWENEQDADDDPKDAQGAEMALQRILRDGCESGGFGNRLAALGTDVEVGL